MELPKPAADDRLSALVAEMKFELDKRGQDFKAACESAKLIRDAANDFLVVAQPASAVEGIHVPGLAERMKKIREKFPQPKIEIVAGGGIIEERPDGRGRNRTGCSSCGSRGRHTKTCTINPWKSAAPAAREDADDQIDNKADEETPPLVKNGRAKKYECMNGHAFASTQPFENVQSSGCPHCGMKTIIEV